MAIYRQVQTCFWTDTKVADDFTPEDRYFYLYLFTNPHTNLSGCYEIGTKQMSNETGYSVDTIERLIKRMRGVHHVIAYSYSTKEILLVNWWRYNWTGSEKFRKSLLNEIDHIKDESFRAYIMDAFDGNNPNLDTVSEKSDTVSADEGYGMDTVSEKTDTVSANDITVTNTVTDTDHIYAEIIGYLNQKAGRRFNHSNKQVREAINARLREGYTEDDFKKVIDNKCHEWLGTEHEQFLRPSTLFAPSHFDEYLNQGMVKKKSENKFNRIMRTEYDMEELESVLEAI